jgi:CheY-like chemotaxis protein
VTTTFQSDPATEIMNLAENCLRRPDLVLVDYGLPYGYSEFDIARDLRAVFGEDLPVVVLISESSPNWFAVNNECVLPTRLKPRNADDIRAAFRDLIDPSALPRART